MSVHTDSFPHFCNILGCCDHMGLTLPHLIDHSSEQNFLCHSTIIVFETQISTHNMHSHMNLIWLTVLTTKQLNDSLLVLFGWFLHLKCRHLSIPHCSCLL